MWALRASRRACNRLPLRAYSSSAPLDIHPEVQEALAHRKPVVALETALVTNGLPAPYCLSVPRSQEAIVRASGAIPATVGLVDGRIKIGLEPSELERLADKESDRKPVKISRRDIGAAIALKRDGGTTCCATLIFAAMAGIKVFSTGGLGGVHRSGESTMDVSADLHELSRCPVGLVSAGVKSILDIGRTLEYLETLGVPVISYNKTGEFPAFFSRQSGFFTPWSTDNPRTAAEILFAQHQLKLQNGALIAVPVPEQYDALGTKVQKFVDQAVEESQRLGTDKLGKDVTPWLLARIVELSQGGSLECNIALLEETARVGSKIAVEYQKLQDQENTQSGTLLSKTQQYPNSCKEGHLLDPHAASQFQRATPIQSSPPAPTAPKTADVVIVGCAALDITAQEHPDTNSQLVRHSTGPGSVQISLGGVGRNVAEATHRVMEAKYPNNSRSSVLVSPVGEDTFGGILKGMMASSGMRTDGLVVPVPAGPAGNARTAVCNMVLDSQGSLVGGVADMGIVKDMDAAEIIPTLESFGPKIVAADGNLSTESLTALAQYCNQSGRQLLFEPTSRIHSTKILHPITKWCKEGSTSSAPIAFCTPNSLELMQLYEVAQSEEYDLLASDRWWSKIESFGLGSTWRMSLEQLARQPLRSSKLNTSSQSSSSGDLSFLIQEGIAQMAINLLPFFQHLIIKCGDRGVVVAMCISPEEATSSSPSAGWAAEQTNVYKRYIVAQGRSKEIIVLQHFPPLQVQKVVNVTGAGDSFVGALLACLADNPSVLYDPKTLAEVVHTAQQAAVLTLGSHMAVSPLLSKLSSSSYAA